MGVPQFWGLWVGEPKFGVVLEVSGASPIGQTLGEKPLLLWGFWFKEDNP